MTTTQIEKAKKFRALHEGPGAFIIPNPWDAGTARMLTTLGFSALATTSAGFAFALGRRDGEGLVSRDDVLQHIRAIVAASDLPVSGDLENGFGHDPKTVAETIRLAAEAGLVGGSIEDASGDPQRPIYEHAHAVERVAAAVESARALPFPFTLTARAENFLHGLPNLDDTIRRLKTFASAGADVLYAPALRSARRNQSGLRCRCPQTSQRAHRRQRPLRRRSRRRRRAQNQRRLGIVSRGPQRFLKRRARNEGTRHLFLRQRRRDVYRNKQLYAGS